MTAPAAHPAPTSPPTKAWQLSERISRILAREYSQYNNEQLKVDVLFEHIRPLGYDGLTNYLISRWRPGIYGLTSEQLNSSKVLRLLAPATALDRGAPGKNGPNFGLIAAVLSDAIAAAGVFTLDHARGVGAWVDDGRPVLHLGDRLDEPDQETPVDPLDFPSTHVYQHSPARRGPADYAVVPRADSMRLIRDAADEMTWENPLSAKLLLGWIVLAPIGGALRWRPHVWICGAAGSGKSRILEDFVRPLLGDMRVDPQGSSSEAGIRAALGSSSLPVVFDEAETSDQRTGARIDAILELMRTASCESEGRVFKGTAGGGRAQQFAPRSMFCLSSVNAPVKLAADRGRIAMLRLRPADDQERRVQWPSLRAKLGRISGDPDIGARLLRLAWTNVHTIRRHCEAWAEVGREQLGSARLGDQYGFLLGAHHALFSDAAIDAIAAGPLNPLPPPVHNLARVYMEDHVLSSYVEPAKDSDAARCLARILQTEVRVDCIAHSQTMTVGSMVAVVAENREWPGDPGATDAIHARLRDMGIAVEVRDGERWIAIAGQSEWLSRALRDSPWQGTHEEALREVEGRWDHVRGNGDNRVRFGPAVGRRRAVFVPVGAVRGEAPEAQAPASRAPQSNSWDSI